MENLTGVANLRHGRFQKHLSALTILWAFFSGFEALYSHYKTNFRYKAQWTPVLLTPVLMAAAAGAVKSRRVANTALPVVSALALADGADRLLLSCARYRAPARRYQEAALQHTLWAPHLCPAAFCRVRVSGPDGELAATGEEMSRKSFPLRATGGEFVDLDQPGYYAGYSTMAQKKHWERCDARRS